MSLGKISKHQSSGGVELCVDVDRDLLTGLDTYSAAFREKPPRHETVRRILRDWLCAQGYMRSPGAVGGTKPEDLNSANDD